jgi:hypothetical protein
MKATWMVSVVFGLAMSFAQAQEPAQGQGKPHGPPPEAINACSGKAAGAECSFTGHHGKTMTGTCKTGHEGSTLACHPNWHKHGEQGQGAPAPGTGQ